MKTDSQFQSVTSDEFKQACATIDKLAASAPETYRNELKTKLTKGNGVIGIAVDRPANAERPTRTDLTTIHPWLNARPEFLPLADAIKELLADDGGPAELSRRQAVLFGEYLASQHNAEQGAKERAADQARWVAEQRARKAAWAALSDQERFIATLGKNRHAEAEPPVGWNP